MSENQIDESQFMIRDEDLMRLAITPELRAHMGIVLRKARRTFLTIYSEMERILNTPPEQLVEIARKATKKWTEAAVRRAQKQIFIAFDFLRSNQREIYIASIPIQGVWIDESYVGLRTVTAPQPYGFFRKAIYDVFPSRCIMLFHPASLYAPENYLGSAIVDAIAECMKYKYEEFSQRDFIRAMETLSEMARPLGIVMWIGKDEARHILSDLKRTGILLVNDPYLKTTILDTEYLSRLLLKKSIIESIPPVG